MFGPGSIFFGSATSKSGAAAVVTGANNGVSLDASGNVTLGAPFGSGAPGKLLNNREVDMNGFDLSFNQIGSTASVQWILSYTAAPAPTAQIVSFYRNDVISCGGIIVTQSDIYFGTAAGAALTGVNNNNNTCIGAQTAHALTSGSHNSFYGAFSGNLVTAGTQNVAVGYASLDQADSSNCVAVGDHACGSIAGTFLVAIGQAAMGGTVTGNTGLTQQVAIGAGALQQTPSVTGTNDVWIGYKCGFNAGISQGSNTMIGALIQSTSINTYGSGNVLVGANINSAGNPGLGNNNIFIGSSIVFGGALGIANSVVIGQGITINMSNVAVLGRSDQNIIIGQTNAAAGTDLGSKLQILGSVAPPLLVSIVNATLDATQFTVILATGHGIATCTLPAASTAKNRIYVIPNNNATPVTVSSYNDRTGSANTSIPANTSLWVQSDGATWWQIN